MLLVTKAEEILKNISLYDLIKLSMSNQKTSNPPESGTKGLRNLLSSSSKEIGTGFKNQG
jgi:hypothetical protein